MLVFFGVGQLKNVSWILWIYLTHPSDEEPNESVCPIQTDQSELLLPSWGVLLMCDLMFKMCLSHLLTEAWSLLAVLSATLHVSDPSRRTCLNIGVTNSGLVSEGQCLGVPDGSQCVKSMSGLVDPALDVIVWSQSLLSMLPRYVKRSERKHIRWEKPSVSIIFNVKMPSSPE